MTTRRLAPLPLVAPPVYVRRPGASARLRQRSGAVLALVWLAGAAPALMRLAFGWHVPASWEAFGWGLWLPGAGFIAVGGGWLLLVPVVWAVFQVAMLAWGMAGMLVAPLAVWLGTALWAAAVAHDPVFPHAAWIVPVLGLATVAWKTVRERRTLAREAVQGEAYAGLLPGWLADLDRRAAAAPDPHELDATQLAAARYLFDLSLQPVGQFEGFTCIENVQSTSLRYQLNYISYALASMQVRYTPKFHGYLNRAQRYAIESLALPKVCGYWKWEYAWGRLGWNPDPIGTLDNVMLTGWSQVALTTYAANTGDLRYQVPGALAFQPMRRNPRTYGHDAHSFTQSIVGNWKQSATTLYACEPHWVFPLCNAYAYSGLVPYDRVNGTRHAADHHAAFIDQLESEFLLPDGLPRGVLNTLTGWSWLSRGLPEQALLSFLLQLSRATNAFHPGYARRWYVIARERYVSVDTDGRLQLRGIEWGDLFDAGHFRKSPGYMLGLLAQAAQEHGDDAIARAALREADERLQRAATPGVLAYERVSGAANINLAAARFGGFADWQNLIVRGPAAAALQGPVLGDCAYPDVLVAAAHGDVDRLDLVLYPGVAPGSQTLRIERLAPSTRYRVRGASVSTIRTGAEETGAVLPVVLDGRSEVSLWREA